MSVRKAERSEGKLQALKLAKDLCVYTHTLCKNQECFPKNQRWLLTSKIAQEAVDVLSCVSSANSVTMRKGSTTKAEFEYRHMKQVEALSHIASLFSLMQVAEDMNGIPERKIEYWTGIADNAYTTIRKWMNADKERFNSYYS